MNTQRLSRPFAAGLLLGIMLMVAACQREPPPAGLSQHEPSESLVLTSPAFEPEALIPEAYTCAGSGARPPLAWSTPPEGTQSLTLVLEKLDGSQVVIRTSSRGAMLWMVFNLPPALSELPEDLSLEEDFRHHELQPVHATNYFGTAGYDGPCPPWREPGRYAFRIYALDTVLNLDAGATEQDLFEAMAGSILAEGELVGTFAYQID